MFAPPQLCRPSLPEYICRALICGACFICSYFEVLDYNGGGAVGMEIDGILDDGMLPMHRSDARIVNVSKECTLFLSFFSTITTLNDYVLQPLHVMHSCRSRIL